MSSHLLRRHILRLAALSCGALVLPAAAQDKTKSKALYQKLITDAADGKDWDDLMKQVEDSDVPTKESLSRAIDALVPKEADAYRKAYSAAARTLTGRFKTKEIQKEILTLRGKVTALRARGGALTKDEIVRDGDPAMKRLKEIYTIDRSSLLPEGSPLQKQRTRLEGLVKVRDKVRGLAGLSPPSKEFSFTGIEDEEKALANREPPYDKAALAIIQKNAEVAKAISAEEAKGIQELNEWRAMLGMSAVMIDVKLCEAARDHSKDMKEQKFFAHESPVSGKKTPWDRAKRAGTSANAENIFMGSKDPHAANMGWFHSPGHHVNMLNPGSRRIGLGNHDTHWTQMFG